jgi:gamma-glutamylcyclotransferase (GGCT)/AIG2-like uncharacterized protein YtfP
LSRKYIVFTYGSLLKGFEANNKLLKDSEFIGNASTKGFMRCTTSDYPIIIYDEKNGQDLSGELYLVDKETMNQLRRYEGIGSFFTFYTEKYIKIKSDSKYKKVRAFIAFDKISTPLKLTSKPVKSGNWREFTSRKRIYIPKRLIFTLSLLIFIGLHFLA